MTLPWYDWLVLSAAELRRCGEDPAKRQEVTGHARPLSRVWARTIGYWCRAEPLDFMEAAGLDTESARDRNTFDVYKSKHRLHTVRSCAAARKVSVDTWRQVSGVVLADDAVLWSEHFEERYPGDRRNIPGLVAKQLGILPVEVVLYREEFHRMLRCTSTTHDEFTKMEANQRVELWDLAEAGIQSPDATRFREALRATPRRLHRD